MIQKIKKQQLIKQYPWLAEIEADNQDKAIRAIQNCKAIGAAVPDKFLYDKFRKKA